MQYYTESFMAWEGFGVLLGYKGLDSCWSTGPPWICCDTRSSDRDAHCPLEASMSREQHEMQCCDRPQFTGLPYSSLDTLRVDRSNGYFFPAEVIRGYLPSSKTKSTDLGILSAEILRAWTFMHSVGFAEPSNLTRGHEATALPSSTDWIWHCHSCRLILHGVYGQRASLLGGCEYAYCPRKMPLAIYSASAKTASRSVAMWASYLDNLAHSSVSLGDFYHELGASWDNASDASSEDVWVQSVLQKQLLRYFKYGAEQSSRAAHWLILDAAHNDGDRSRATTLHQLAGGAARSSSPIQLPPAWAPTCCRLGNGRLRLFFVRNPFHAILSLLRTAHGDIGIEHAFRRQFLAELEQGGASLGPQEMLIQRVLGLDLAVRNQADLWASHGALLIHFEFLVEDIAHAWRCLCNFYGHCDQRPPPFPWLNKSPRVSVDYRNVIVRQLWNDSARALYLARGGVSELMLLGYAKSALEPSPILFRRC